MTDGHILIFSHFQNFPHNIFSEKGLMRIQSILEESVLKFPKTILVIFLLLTGLAVAQLPKLINDPSPYLLPKSHPSRVNLDQLRDNFTGSNDGVLILMEAENDVFNPQTFQRIQTLTERFEELTLITDTDVANLKTFSEKIQGESQELLTSLLEDELTQESWEELDAIREALKLDLPVFCS